MGRLATADLRVVRDLSARLASLEVQPSGPLASIHRDLSELFRAPVAQQSLRAEADTFELAGLWTHGISDRTKNVIAQAVRSPVTQWAHYNPARPEPAQRNTALLASEVVQLQKSDRPRQLLFDIAASIARPTIDQVRVLVCDGPTLLAWVGAFSPDPFTWRERALLQRLTPALQQRLILERHLRHASLSAVTAAAALEAISSAAFVLDADARVVECNRLGRALLDADASALREALRNAVGSRPSTLAFDRTELRVFGQRTHHLAVLRRGPADPAPRVAAATRRWGLTAREAQVLALMAQGKPNKTIADQLAISESTVEVHAARVIAKAHAEGRLALMAQFWTEL